MSLNLDDDDDELRKMRERFMQSAPEGAAAGGNPYGAPSRELDPRMLQSFLAQKPAESPQQSAYPIPQREQGIGVADWFPLAAAGLDLAFNKGRGMGGIAQSAAGMAQRRDALSQQQFEDDRGAYMKQQDAQADAEARKQNYGIASGNLQLRQLEADLAAARERGLMERFAKGMPDPELTKREKEAEIRLREAQADDASATAYGKWTKDPNALSPEAKALNEDRDAARADRKAELKERGLDRDEARKMRITQADAVEYGKYTKAKEAAEEHDRLATESFNTKTKDERAQAAMLKGVQPTLNDPKYKDDLPGVGKIDSAIPSWLAHPFDATARDDADTVKKMMGQATAYFNHEITGAASSDRERALNQALKGLNGTEAEVKVALKFWQDDLQGKIRSSASASPANARKSLEAQGLDQWVGGWGPESEAQAYPEYKSPYADILKNMDAPPSRDLETPGPETQEPAQRLGASGPNYRGTQGYPGSGDPRQPYQGPTTKPFDLETLRKNTRTPGVVYRP